MNFALLAKTKAKKEEANQEFNVEKYLNKVSKLTTYMDTYMLNEPIQLLNACESFDRANFLLVSDPVISLKQMFGE